MDKTVVVPVEPTEQMKEAGAKAIQDNGGEGAFDMLVTDAMAAYAAMIAAAPAPAAQDEPQVSSEKERLFDYLTALATDAGFPNISTAIAEARWGKADPQDAQERNAIIEECAKVCEFQVERFCVAMNGGAAYGANECVKAILDLKTAQPAVSKQDAQGRAEKLTCLECRQEGTCMWGPGCGDKKPADKPEEGNYAGAKDFIEAIICNKPIWPNGWGQDVAAVAFMVHKMREQLADKPVPAQLPDPYDERDGTWVALKDKPEVKAEQQAEPIVEKRIYDIVAKHEVRDGLWNGPKFTHEGILAFSNDLLKTEQHEEQEMTDAEILQIAAENGHGYAGDGKVSPFNGNEDIAADYISFARALLAAGKERT